MSKPKFTITKDDASCFGPSWFINGRTLEEGETLAQNEELLDRLLVKVKEAVKAGEAEVESLLNCLQAADHEPDEGPACETCGHCGQGKTTWKV